MTPLPGPLGGADLVAWRLDQAAYATSWDAGEGAYRVGGRWNGPGIRAVYCAIDPATAILEVAVHKGFKKLDTVPHVLTSVTIDEPASVAVVDPEAIPDPDWLRPGVPSPSQQAYGAALLARHRFVLIPSVVSRESWNLIFVRSAAAGAYATRSQATFILDPRLHRPSAP